jgi:hypothetical protein
MRWGSIRVRVVPETELIQESAEKWKIILVNPCLEKGKGITIACYPLSLILLWTGSMNYFL